MQLIKVSSPWAAKYTLLTTTHPSQRSMLKALWNRIHHWWSPRTSIPQNTSPSQNRPNLSELWVPQCFTRREWRQSKVLWLWKKIIWHSLQALATRTLQSITWTFYQQPSFKSRTNRVSTTMTSSSGITTNTTFWSRLNCLRSTDSHASSQIQISQMKVRCSIKRKE